MITTGEMFSNFTSRLAASYEKNEAERVAVLAFEHVLKYRRIDVSLNKDKLLDQESEGRLNYILKELLKDKPIQYVLGHAWFHGMRLEVNSEVLIPRPETEELVAWILEDFRASEKKPPMVVDLCTGSGCIALAIKRNIPDSTVMATDISRPALEVAGRNASSEKLDIAFMQMDALNMKWDIRPDIVVSNPPYVLESEKLLMKKQVRDFEPVISLFVPDSDPLIFYRSISLWAFQNLNRGGKLYFEINETKHNEILDLLKATGFRDPEARKDLQGKFRMFRALKD